MSYTAETMTRGEMTDSENVSEWPHPIERLEKLLESRASGEMDKLAFREAAVRELVLLESAKNQGHFSRGEYERWEDRIAAVAYDPEDLTMITIAALVGRAAGVDLSLSAPVRPRY